MIRKFLSVIKNWFIDSRLYQSLLNLTENIRYYTGNSHYVKDKSSRYELREKYRRLIFIIIGSCFLIFLVVYGIHWLSFFNALDNSHIKTPDWLGFVSSYWGAIIGAVLSGLITIITTSMIINRSYKVDYHRERIDHMPIFLINHCKHITTSPEVFAKASECYLSGYISSDSLIFLIKNVGKGIGVNIRTFGGNDTHEEAVIPIITVGEFKYLITHIPKGGYPDYTEDYENSNFVIEYTDLFENKYEQRFLIREMSISGEIVVIGYVPKLIKKTERARYIQ